MLEMIEERRQSASEGKSDLFTNLIKATSQDPDQRTARQLSDNDLMGMYPRISTVFSTTHSSS
jgi:hypothetical protein